MLGGIYMLIYTRLPRRYIKIYGSDRFGYQRELGWTSWIFLEFHLVVVVS